MFLHGLEMGCRVWEWGILSVRVHVAKRLLTPSHWPPCLWEESLGHLTSHFHIWPEPPCLWEESLGHLTFISDRSRHVCAKNPWEISHLTSYFHAWRERIVSLNLTSHISPPLSFAPCTAQSIYAMCTLYAIYTICTIYTMYTVHIHCWMCTVYEKYSVCTA